MGVIVTAAGTGSECKGGAVITNEELKRKTGRDYPRCNPRFALLDPTYTYSVPMAGYNSPSEHPGTLEKLTYQTWESFSYEEQAQELTKEAWVYLPYGYSEEQKYNVFYLSHGGWSNETTIMGTDQSAVTKYEGLQANRFALQANLPLGYTNLKRENCDSVREKSGLGCSAARGEAVYEKDIGVLFGGSADIMFSGMRK